MRVIRRTNGPASPEDVAVAVRLLAITARGRIEVEHYSTLDTAIEIQEPQRLFRRPDEIVAQNGVA